MFAISVVMTTLLWTVAKSFETFGPDIRYESPDRRLPKETQAMFCSNQDLITIYYDGIQNKAVEHLEETSDEIGWETDMLDHRMTIYKFGYNFFLQKYEWIMGESMTNTKSIWNQYLIVSGLYLPPKDALVEIYRLFSVKTKVYAYILFLQASSSPIDFENTTFMPEVYNLCSFSGLSSQWRNHDCFNQQTLLDHKILDLMNSDTEFVLVSFYEATVVTIFYVYEKKWLAYSWNYEIRHGKMNKDIEIDANIYKICGSFVMNQKSHLYIYDKTDKRAFSQTVTSVQPFMLDSHRQYLDKTICNIKMNKLEWNRLLRMIFKYLVIILLVVGTLCAHFHYFSHKSGPNRYLMLKEKKRKLQQLKESDQELIPLNSHADLSTIPDQYLLVMKDETSGASHLFLRYRLKMNHNAAIFQEIQQLAAKILK